MNRMVPIATIRKTDQRQNLTPMVVSGTHTLDMSMYLMGKTPVSVYAPLRGRGARHVGHKDSTFGIFTMHDGTLEHEHQLGLPHVSPGAVYGLQGWIVAPKASSTLRIPSRSGDDNTKSRSAPAVPRAITDRVSSATSFSPAIRRET